MEGKEMEEEKEVYTTETTKPTKEQKDFGTAQDYQSRLQKLVEDFAKERKTWEETDQKKDKEHMESLMQNEKTHKQTVEKIQTELEIAEKKMAQALRENESMKQQLKKLKSKKKEKKATQTDSVLKAEHFCEIAFLKGEFNIQLSQMNMKYNESKQKFFSQISKLEEKNKQQEKEIKKITKTHTNLKTTFTEYQRRKQIEDNNKLDKIEKLEHDLQTEKNSNAAAHFAYQKRIEEFTKKFMNSKNNGISTQMKTEHKEKKSYKPAATKKRKNTSQDNNGSARKKTKLSPSQESSTSVNKSIHTTSGILIKDNQNSISPCDSIKETSFKSLSSLTFDSTPNSSTEAISGDPKIVERFRQFETSSSENSITSPNVLANPLKTLNIRFPRAKTQSVPLHLQPVHVNHHLPVDEVQFQKEWSFINLSSYLEKLPSELFDLWEIKGSDQRDFVEPFLAFYGDRKVVACCKLPPGSRAPGCIIWAIPSNANATLEKIRTKIGGTGGPLTGQGYIMITKPTTKQTTAA